MNRTIYQRSENWDLNKNVKMSCRDLQYAILNVTVLQTGLQPILSGFTMNWLYRANSIPLSFSNHAMRLNSDCVITPNSKALHTAPRQLTFQSTRKLVKIINLRITLPHCALRDTYRIHSARQSARPVTSWNRPVRHWHTERCCIGYWTIMRTQAVRALKH